MEAYITSLQSKIERLEDHLRDSSDALLSIKAKAEEVETERSERDRVDRVELDAAADAIKVALASYVRSHQDKKAQDQDELLDFSAEVSRLLPKVMRPSMRHPRSTDLLPFPEVLQENEERPVSRSPSPGTMRLSPSRQRSALLHG